MRAGLPREPAELLALVAAALLLLAAPRLARVRDRVFVTGAACLAAALSALYVVFYLRGGPRIIDATTYFAEARALAEGHLSFELREPAASTMGRFLVRAGDGGDRAAAIFPPGYPAVLALGFLARAPLAIGPLLAALLVVATWGLARRVAPDRPDIARTAAAISVACAALRYHTADTMSHGLAALCFAGALALGFSAFDAEASPKRARWAAAGAGALAGWLTATRPATALALVATVVIAFAASSERPRSGAAKMLLVSAAIGAIPGLALLVAHQHAATGAWFVSSQRLYYEVADGPSGCFAYGFGPRVGCLNEHGDFVRAHLTGGYGALEAIGTTLRRLRLHLVDAANAEPLFVFVLAGGWLARKLRRGRILVVAIVAQIVIYAPFYFDGNYPGGGARLFADVLPAEHVLFGIAAGEVARRARDGAPRALAAAVPVALALVGFAFRAGFEHAALRDREGGRPMFEPRELASRGITRGLLFFSTDHGFDLAFDPDADPRTGVAAVRLRGDGIDTLAWIERGRPPAFVYDYGVESGAVRIAPWKPVVDANDAFAIEGESLWPPLAQHAARAAVEFASGTCASSGRILAVHPDGPHASVRLELPRALAGRTITPTLAIAGTEGGALELYADDRLIHRWSIPGSPSFACTRLGPAPLPPDARKIHLEVIVEHAESNDVFGVDLLDIAGSKYVDPLLDKVRDSQGIH